MNSTNSIKNNQKKETIKAILASLESGSSMKKACNAAGIDYSTFWLWRKNSKCLDVKVEAALDSRITIVEDALFKKAKEGNVTAQIFWLQNRASDRWQDKRNISTEHTGKVELIISKEVKDV